MFNKLVIFLIRSCDNNITCCIFFHGEIIKELMKRDRTAVGKKHLYFITCAATFSRKYFKIFTISFYGLFLGVFLQYIKLHMTHLYLAHVMLVKLFFTGKFYTDSRSRLLFGKLFAELAKNFPTEKIDQLKHLIQCMRLHMHLHIFEIT